MLISSPMKVRTFGWTLDNASALTIALMMRPKNRPIARVTVMRDLLLEFVDGQQFENFQFFRAARRLHFHGVADFFAEQRFADRRSRGDLAVARRRLLRWSPARK